MQQASASVSVGGEGLCLTFALQPALVALRHAGRVRVSKRHTSRGQCSCCAGTLELARLDEVVCCAQALLHSRRPLTEQEQRQAGRPQELL